MTKDACENSDTEPKNKEMLKESVEDENENSNVSSREERLFGNSHMDRSNSTNEDPSNPLNAKNEDLVEHANCLRDKNLSLETGVSVSSSGDFENNCGESVLLKFNENESPSFFSSDKSNFSASYSETKKSSPILEHCKNREEIFNFDYIPSTLEKEQSRIKTQINECIEILKDITEKISNDSSPVKDIELDSDVNKLKYKEKYKNSNDSQESSGSDTAKHLSKEKRNSPKSTEIPSSTNYAVRSHSKEIFSEEGNLKEKVENNPEDAELYEDQSVIEKDAYKAASPEKVKMMKDPNSDNYGYKSGSFPLEPESLVALVKKYKSEKYLKIVQKFFDPTDLKTDEKTDLGSKGSNEHQDLEETHQSLNEGTNDHDCLNEIRNHDENSNEKKEMNELCSNPTNVSTEAAIQQEVINTASFTSNSNQHFDENKNEESDENSLFLSEKTCCSKEIDHEKDPKKDTLISLDENSEQMCKDTQKSADEDVENPQFYTNIESTKNKEEKDLCKLSDEPPSTLKEFLPLSNCIENQNLNDDSLQNEMPLENNSQLHTEVLEHRKEVDSFQTLISSEGPTIPSNTNKETSICEELNKTEQCTQPDPFLPFWQDRDTDEVKYQYPFAEPIFIQQSEDLMAAEVVKSEPNGVEIGSYLDQYSGGDIFDSLRNLNSNVDFTSFDNVLSSDVTIPSFDLLEQPPPFEIDRYCCPLESSSSSKEFSEPISNNIQEQNSIQDKKKNSANVRIQILSRKEKHSLGPSNENLKSSPLYGTIKIRTPGNRTTIQSFSFSPTTDKNGQQFSKENKTEHTCLGVLRPIKKGVTIEGAESGIPAGTRRIVFSDKSIENENESGFSKFKVGPSIKLIVPKDISQVKNTNTESEKNEKENSRIKVHACTTGAKSKDGTGSVISYFSKAAGLIPSSSNQRLETDNVHAKSLRPKRNSDVKLNDDKLKPNCIPKPNLLRAVPNELTTESPSETPASCSNRIATPLPAAMISSRTRSKRLSLIEDTLEINTTSCSVSKRMRSSDGDGKTPPIIKISEIVDNYAAKFQNASAVLQQRIPKKDFSKKHLLEKVYQSQVSVIGQNHELPNTDKPKSIADLTLEAVQELNGGQGSTVFDIMSYVRSRVSRNDVNVSQGVRETLKEAAGGGNIQLKSGRYVVTQILTGKEKGKPKLAKRKSSTVDLPRRTKSLRIFRKPYDENDPCL